jgi:DNA polymerase III alpha subunit
LGQTVISGIEHGWAGRIIETIELAKELELKPLLGTESYFVKDRLEKDATNAHLIILAKNENGRKSLNKILSQANIDGFYYKPRLDLDLVLSLPKDDLWVTTACVGGIWKYEDAEDIMLKLLEHFQQNLFLEVQNHWTDKQKVLNERILRLSNQYNIKIIAGMDSHLIFNSQNQDRDNYLQSRGIVYPDEENWFLDYPDYGEAFSRFEQQGILNKHQIEEALGNTNIFESVEPYNSKIFDSSTIKLPTLYPNKSQEEKNDVLCNLVWEKWDGEKATVPEKDWEKYKKEIRKELDVVIKTGMADYFLLDYEIIKKGKELGGQITLTGRGCFTEESLVLTLLGLKKISEIKIGDTIINEDGLPSDVVNTFKYNVDEELVQIEHLYGTKKYNPTICTKDHKILIYDGKKRFWKKAGEVLKGDYVCLPFIKFNDNSKRTIDLNEYNQFGFEYDENYIYETIRSYSKPYPFSPSEMAKKYGVGKSVFEKFATGKNNSFSRKKWIAQRFFSETPFETQQEYVDYVAKTKIKKINRYIENDTIFNNFVGLMYGDGFTINRGANDIGLAICKDSDKDKNNRSVFYEIAKRIGVGVYENVDKKRRLIQLSLSSRVFRQFVAEELFVSKDGKDKVFNSNLFFQNKENLLAIKNGLMMSDGHFSKKEFERDSFDNTSLSIIGAFKIINMATGGNPLAISTRPAHIDTRGWNSKESYKLKDCERSGILKKKYLRCLKDDKYWYLPITNTKTIVKKTSVYDLTIGGKPSFVINNMVVHNSAPSFYLSKLLGFTTIDRISATVKLFPERFISAERLLETKSLPDIDFNLGNPEVFARAQEEVLGCGHSYPMIAFGTVKTLGAWKIYARVADIDFDIANAVSEQIQAYEMDLKHAETDEEKEEINILDYIGYQYQNAFRESSKFLGLVNTLTPHPCAYLLYSDGDVREEFGLIKIKTGDVEHICVCCDGLFAENYKFLKNDLLKVNVVKLIYGVYNRIGIEPHPLPELLKICKNDKKVWDIYATATTMGINQVEQTGSSGRVAKYKPQNISEISAFVAAIRPGFKSNYKQFESREPFCYGIPSLDNLIQTKEFPYSYLIYQENSMQAMAYAGIPISQTYEIVKNIAKKRVEKVLKYKEQFVSGMKKKIKTQEKVSDKEAEDISNKTWQIIEDSSRYAFNSSHSYSVAGDSLYGAYLKSHYPLEFYEVFLQMLEEDGDKDRLADVRKEAEKEFHIKFPRFRFGQDNRNIVANKERNEITSSLKTLKGFGGAEGERLYDLSKQFSGKDFLELLIFAEENGGISSKWESLLKIDYFADFGNNQKLLSIFKEFKSGKNRYSKKLTDKSKEKRIPELRKIFDELPNNKLPIVEQVRADVETLGTIQSVFPEIKINKEYRIAYVLDLNLKYSPRVQLYNLKAGNQMSFKIRKMFFNNDPFDVGTVILCKHFEKKKPTKYVNGKYEENPDADFEYWIDNYSIIENFDEWMKRNG